MTVPFLVFGGIGTLWWFLLNPMREVSVPKGLTSADTIAYSLEEVQIMLRVLPEPDRNC
jgi:hypothetical protein